MPTNLPPDYFEIEKEFRAARSTTEKIALLEELISVVPKHKGTDHLRADLRRRLSKLREPSLVRKGIGRHESSFLIDKEGAGQVAVVGPPNVGKSALVAALTNANPEVSEAPFTTWEPSPGMMQVADIQVQLIDTPPLHGDYVEPRLMDLLRRVDLILLVVDLETNPDEQLQQSLGILMENRIVPRRLVHQYDGTRRPAVKPVIVVANKADDEASTELFHLFCEFIEQDWDCIPVSAATGRNFQLLKREVFDALNIIRVYSKPPGKAPDLNAPYVARKGTTVQEFAAKVHKDFVENLSTARVWGSSEFEGQMVPREHVLQDGDVVELRI